MWVNRAAFLFPLVHPAYRGVDNFGDEDKTRQDDEYKHDVEGALEVIQTEGVRTTTDGTFSWFRPVLLPPTLEHPRGKEHVQPAMTHQHI